MEKNIEDAVKLYSGDRPIGLFVEKLEQNLNKLNDIFDEISDIFTQAKIIDFSKLPDDRSERAKFSSLFKEFNNYLEAAKIQGFSWDKTTYEFNHDEDNTKTRVELKFDENTYLVLALRYKELFTDEETDSSDAVPYEIEGYLTEIDTGRIDADYMNSRFERYLRILTQEGVDESEKQSTLNDLHRSFAMLTQEEQRYANIFLHEVESGSIRMQSGKNFRDYVNEYQAKAENDRIRNVVRIFGADESKLRNLMSGNLNDTNINEFGRFDALRDSVDKAKAREYFERLGNVKLKPFKINVKIDAFLRKFILSGGFDIETFEE